MFSEGCTELGWCKRIFDSSDLPKAVSWKEFLKKGYHVLPPEPEATRDPTNMRWYAEGRMKDEPEMNPLPALYSEEFGKGLQTPSGKIEFVSNTLKRVEADNPDRPALNRYLPSWEGPHTKELFEHFPLQLISSHPTYSFHTYGDGKESTINDIKDHRLKVDGYYYWVVRVNPADAEKRGIKQHDRIRLYNNRYAVICVADVSPLVRPGVIKTFESCAVIDLIRTAKGMADRGGCVNLLTSDRTMERGTSGIAPNSCLIEIEKWDGQMLEAAE
jgi:trimethylamine-N-oxide reductase (cytochrome c)